MNNIYFCIYSLFVPVNSQQMRNKFTTGSNTVKSRESISNDASCAPVLKEVDVEIEIDQPSLPDSDVHQNISSDSATAENEKQQTICSQASVIVSESIFQESETPETDMNDHECRKINLVHTETELPDSTATFPELMLEDTENTLKNADNATLLWTERYLRCLGQLRRSSEKLSSLVSEATDQNQVHLKSAYTQLISTCKRVVTMVEDVKESAKVGLQSVQNQTEAESDMLEDSNLIEHDPARRPAMLTRNQTKYLIHLGPYQPKLSMYPHNLELIKKGKQSSFSQTWFDDYPYLEYSILTNKAYCFVCSIFGKEGDQRERSERKIRESVDRRYR